MQAKPDTRDGSELIVPSWEVPLDGEPYQRFKQESKAWSQVDHYTNPGPIQYAGVGADSRTESLQLYA